MSTSLRHERLLVLPLEAAMTKARQSLEARGLQVESSTDASRLRTEWTEVAPGQGFTRHVVAASRVDANHSLLRIFRISSPTRNQPSPGNLRWTRDSELEQQLIASLPAGAWVDVGEKGIEVASPRPLIRDADFYLERWKSEATGGLAESQRCSQPVDGMRSLIQPGFTLLVGEQLGSREAPAVVGELVCEAAEAGQDVALGLSIPSVEQERIDQYLSSLGSPMDQDELLRGDFWRRPYQDGRSSWAVVDLLDTVRALRASGLSISVVAFDVLGTVGSDRDAKMAGVWLKRREAHPEEGFIILAGNAHTQIAQGASWDSAFEPMAWLLSKADPRVKTLELSYAPGQRWGCNLLVGNELSCRIVTADPSERVAGTPGQEPHIRMFTSLSWGFHGLLYVGALSPSMPATSLEGHDVRKADDLRSPLQRQRRRIQFL